MCQPDRSCNVNEDNGITLAHTITHEMGHKYVHSTTNWLCRGEISETAIGGMKVKQ
jgi:hypothetical protein